ncbi:hypothetical protein C8Q75DRAFT_732431 [Abortiporus biennis]|nr:hypothetical protein C8Q75DRAFT_732431 [Abortiporus biennis]
MDFNWAEISLDDFMTKILPSRLHDPTTEESDTFRNFSGIKFVGNEKEMYPVLCEGIQSAFISNHLSVKDTGDWTEREGDDTKSILPLTLFRPTDKDQAKEQLLGKDTNSPAESSQKDMKLSEEKFDHTTRTPQTLYDLDPKQKNWLAEKHAGDEEYLSRLPFAARTSFSGSVSFIQVRYNTADFPFGITPKGDLIPTNKGGEKTREQLTEYAAEIFRRQHRNFVFSVSISRRHARFMRWDRQGAIVSESFNYVSEPRKLHQFFYKLDQMTDVELGYDSSVSVASPHEASLMRSHVPTNNYHLELLQKATKGSEIIYKVPVQDGNTTRDFLVGRTLYSSPSIIGRGSKVFVAYDMKDHRLVLLKDVWRVLSSCLHPEHEVYAKLKASNVKHIATVVCAGDVVGPYTRTLTQEYITVGRYHNLQHYRLVLGEIGRPLCEYRSEDSLLRYILHILYAHWSAWTKAGILHGDISPNNIVLVENSSGTTVAILIDWDLCKYKEDIMKESPTQSQQSNRSGTYVFMSALLLNFPKKRHELSDDLESIIHLINWFALDYHQHDLSHRPDDFAIHVNWIYLPRSSRFLDDNDDSHSVPIDKIEKLRCMRNGDPRFELVRSPGLQELITSLMKLAKKHYATVDFEALKTKPVVASPPSVKQSHSQTFPDAAKLEANHKIVAHILAEFRKTSVLTDSDETSSSYQANTPAKTNDNKPTIFSGFLYDHKDMIRIIAHKYRESKAEIMMIQKAGGLGVRPGFEFKWKPSKISGQLEKLPVVEFYYDSERSSSCMDASTECPSTDSDDAESLDGDEDAEDEGEFDVE